MDLLATAGLMNTLVIGSYLFGAAVWGLMWRELKLVKIEIVNLRLQLAAGEGLERGQDHEARIARLEHLTLK